MEKEKYIDVKFIKKHWQYAYMPGDLGKVKSSEVPELHDQGYVILLPDDDNGEMENPLPEDMPLRDELFSKLGVNTAEEVKALLEGGKLAEEGFSKAKIAKLDKYFKK
ncbi:MAG: hypothetical protein J6X92_02665 [Bacteroidales bacterium]|nr:hypothetical protein [Bacteroidales bacterium]